MDLRAFYFLIHLGCALQIIEKMIYLEQNAALVGHKGLVTKMVFNWFNPNLLVSASRGKFIEI